MLLAAEEPNNLKHMQPLQNRLKLKATRLPNANVRLHSVQSGYQKSVFVPRRTLNCFDWHSIWSQIQNSSKFHKDGHTVDPQTYSNIGIKVCLSALFVHVFATSYIVMIQWQVYALPLRNVLLGPGNHAFSPARPDSAPGISVHGAGLEIANGIYVRTGFKV